MLNEQQWQGWHALAKGLSKEQQLWLAGYITGAAGGAGVSANAGAKAGQLDVYFATETGNSKMVSQQLVKAAKQASWKANAKPVSKLKPADLAKADHPVAFVLATHGEGDPPEAAHGFWDALQSADADLSKLQFLTLGLGDSSYAEFCGFARKVDAKLEALGAKALLPRTELDVDFASHLSAWVKQAVQALPAKEGAGSAALSFAAEDDEPQLRTGLGYSRLQPIKGTVCESVNLNDTGSAKETYHIALEYDADVTYEPGDAAGIIIPVQEGQEALTPRLYSIASSARAFEGEVHLTVSRAWFIDESGQKRYGVCSDYLAGLQEGDEVEFYIQQNMLFKLPADDVDVIMVGPGTGIAPFRSFVQERVERGASGRNWLFFGEQHAHCDFLYQQEWIDYAEMGDLHRIDLAFSRDQAEKVYVQHKMREKAAALCEWLDGGAYLYVCGSKDPMSHDVDNALKEILTTHYMSEEKALEMIEQLVEDGRYVKDVY